MRLLVVIGGLAVALAFMQQAGQEDLVHNPNSAVFLHNRSGFLTSENKAKPEAIARAFIAKTLGDGEWVLRSSYGTKHNGVHHLAFRRHFSGVECANCDVTVNIDKYGRVINIGYQHVSEEALTMHAAKNQVNLITAVEAVQAFVDHAKIMPQDQLTAGNFLMTDEEGFKHTFTFPALAEATKTDGAVTATLQYYFDSIKNEIATTWKVEMQTEAPRTAWYEAWMHAETKERVAVIDLVDWDGPSTWTEAENPIHGIYEIYNIPDIDPLLGERTIERDAEDAEASPMFWNRQSDQRNFQVTIGNNVYAQENWAGGSQWQNNYRPSGGSNLNFQFPIDFTRQPDEYADAAIANLFYWNNVIHDIFQLHGFDEASGNFQENNMGRGGRENDAVQANAQDGAGYNNANFATPIDGQRPRMRMYLWNGITPMRDGDLDSGIIVHEYGHGISQRLTGGPLNVGCLRGGQSGGMGEGWGDWWATIFSMRREYVRDDAFPMGLYAARRGIRPFPYSGSMTVNPQTYGYLTRSGYSGVHAIGSVWCQILFSVYWEMVDEYGFSPDWYRGEAGNNILFQNVVDGLKLQPCNPTFIQARNAMMQADQANYGGRHQCTMWKAFAQRGLGFSAATGPVREAFDLPPECR